MAGRRQELNKGVPRKEVSQCFHGADSCAGRRVTTGKGLTGLTEMTLWAGCP